MVGEIMILSYLLPLGRQVLEKNQVRFGFSPCSFTFFPKINLASLRFEQGAQGADFLFSESM